MSEDLEFLKEIIDEFLSDAEQLASVLDERATALADGSIDDDGLGDYASSLHALRMQSGFLDFDSLSDVALGMERLVDAMREGQVQSGDEVVALLDEGRQALDRAMEQLRAYDTTPLDLGNLIERLGQAQRGEDIAEAIAGAEAPAAAPAAGDDAPEMQIAALGDGGEDEPIGDGEEEQAPAAAAEAGEPAAAAEAAEPAAAEAAEPAPAAADVEIPELEFVEVQEGPIPEDVMDFVGDFITESSEILDKLDEDLVHLEEAPEDLDLLNEIFRAAHTLKGTSSFLGFAQMSDLTHKMENVLDLLRKNEMKLNQGIMDTILQGVDHIKVLQEDIRNNAIARHDLDAVRHSLLVIAETKGASAGSPPPAAPEPEAAEEGAAAPAEGATPAAPAEGAPARPAAHTDQVIRVDVDRIDKIMTLAEELVLGRNRLLQLNTQLLDHYSEDELVSRVDEATGQVGMLTGELQESVMKMRMVPVTRVFSRFPRMVRDLARDLEKQIELVIEDHDTEIDKSVADEIGDPLIHLIRNAVDHGVEDPATRKEKGKDAKGTVLLTATHEGNHIVIRIKDDGAGMDPEKLKAKAIEKGILTPADAQQMEDHESYNLIFAPGFSTAAKVTGVSGRGVGMDVVKTNITRLNGTIELDSTLGEGTEVTIRLPLTLAIIGGLQIAVGEEIFIIPLTSVIEATRIATADLDHMRGRTVIKLRGKVLPIVDLRQVLDVPGAQARDGSCYVVVVGLAERRAGVLVDQLMGQPEVVIKALGDFVGPANGIAGATILGDGRVRLILDVGELMELMENGLALEAGLETNGEAARGVAEGATA